MLSKRDILDELRRTAAENNGTPLGRSRFERETGIKPYDWMRYWVRFTDAQKEAGLTPNLLKIAHSENHLIAI